MAGNLLDLANRLRSYGSKIDTATNDAKKAVATAVVNSLIQKTPVDTSKALSNWQVTTTQPAQGDISPFFPGIYGSTRGASMQQAMNEAQYQINGVKPGQTIFITNNVDYIEKLEGGSSSQAPAGFLAASLLVGRITLQKFKLKLR